MIWKAVAKNFETDYNSHILHCDVSLNSELDQTLGATNCSLSSFKFIYVSVKDLRRMLLNLRYTVTNQAVSTY